MMKMMKQQTKAKYEPSLELELAPSGKEEDNNDPEIGSGGGPAFLAAEALLPADDTKVPSSSSGNGEEKQSRITTMSHPLHTKKQKHTRKTRKWRKTVDDDDDDDDEEEEVEDDDDDEYSTTQPGAIPVPGPGGHVLSTETIYMGAETVTNTNDDFVAGDYTTSSLLSVPVKADLVPEVPSASTIDMKIERLETLRKNRYKNYLIGAVVFYVLSFLFDLFGVGVILSAVHPLPDYSTVMAWLPGAMGAMVGLILLSVAMCLMEDDVGPQEKRLFRLGFVSTSVGLILFVAAWPLVDLRVPVHSVAGYILFLVSATGFVTTMICAVLLLKSPEARDNKKLIRLWFFLVGLFLALLGIAVWRYYSWNPPIYDYPDCDPFWPQWIGDGECDVLDCPSCASEECGFDGGDCGVSGVDTCAVDSDCASNSCNDVDQICK